MTTMSMDVYPAREHRALGVLLGSVVGVIAMAGVLSSCAARGPAVRSADRIGRDVRDCMLTAMSCADVARCAPDVACTEMTEAQARQEGLIR